jgi:hypothetical protein
MQPCLSCLKSACLPILLILLISSKKLFTQLPHQNFADELGICGAFAELHDLTLEGVDGVLLARLEVGDALRVGGDGLVAKGFERSHIADLSEAEFRHQRGGGFAGGDHLREDFLGLLAVDFARGGEFGELGEEFGCDFGQCLLAGGGGEEIVEQKIGDGGAVGRFERGGFLEVIGQRGFRREHARLVGADAELADEPQLFRLGQFGHAGRRHFIKAVIGPHRLDVGIGEVAVIVRLFLRAHERRFAFVVVPAPRLLLDRAAGSDHVDLPRDLVLQRAPHAADAVEILQFAFGAEFFLAFRPHGNIHVAAHLALFHVGIADTTVNQDLLERREVGEGFLGRRHVGLADDFHQRRSGAIEVDAAGTVLEVERLGHVLLEVNAHEPDRFVGDGGRFLLHVFRIGEQVERDRAARAERLVVLRDLVILRHVRVEIILPVELAARGDLAPEHFAGEERLDDRLLVRHGQHAGHAEADGAHMRIGRPAEFVFAAAEHLRVRLELDVDFKSDDDFVIGGGEGGGDGHG